MKIWNHFCTSRCDQLHIPTMTKRRWRCQSRQLHRCSGTCGSPVRYTVQACLHTFKHRNDYMCAHRNHAQYRYSRALLLQRTEHLREKIFCFLVGALLGQNCPIPLADNHTVEALCVFNAITNVHKLKSSKNEAQNMQPSKQDLRF